MRQVFSPDRLWESVFYESVHVPGNGAAKGFAIQVGWSPGSARAANAKQKRGYQEAHPLLAINLSFLSTSAPSHGLPFSVTQLTFLQSLNNCRSSNTR